MIHQCPHVFWIIFLMGNFSHNFINWFTSGTTPESPSSSTTLSFCPMCSKASAFETRSFHWCLTEQKKFQPKMPPYATYIYLIGDPVMYGLTWSLYFLMFNWFDTSFASASQALENLRFVFDSVNSTSTKWHKSSRYFTTACVLRAASVAAIFSCQNGGSQNGLHSRVA